MDVNNILLLVAVLNLAGDLYSIFRFRAQLPRWIPVTNIVALLGCCLAWLLAPTQAGLIAIGILISYVVSIKIYSGKKAPARRLASPITKLIIGLNVTTFSIQFLYNATDNPRGFVELGALFTPFLERGEWWRLISAQFLHWGLLHLLFNMMGLWFLGPFVENLLGVIRFILAYLACGVGGMAIAVGLSYLLYPEEPMLMLGASASVLGLVGLQAAISLRALRRSGSLFAKAQLASMTQIVVLQTIFDFMVPEVSSTAHLGGAAVGFLIGMLVKIRWDSARIAAQ